LTGPGAKAPCAKRAEWESAITGGLERGSQPLAEHVGVPTSSTFPTQRAAGNRRPLLPFGAKMKPGVTTEFETTEFAGITAKIINPYPSPFTVLDMTIKPGFGAPAHISSTEDKLFMLIEGN
jgi:hypothetical protein